MGPGLKFADLPKFRHLKNAEIPKFTVLKFACLPKFRHTENAEIPKFTVLRFAYLPKFAYLYAIKSRQ